MLITFQRERVQTPRDPGKKQIRRKLVSTNPTKHLPYFSSFQQCHRQLVSKSTTGCCYVSAANKSKCYHDVGEDGKHPTYHLLSGYTLQQHPQYLHVSILLLPLLFSLHKLASEIRAKESDNNVGRDAECHIHLPAKGKGQGLSSLITLVG